MSDDTERARKAIDSARGSHRDVMGGLSMAELKLQAMAGLLRDDDLPYSTSDPVWTSDAAEGLRRALEACAELHTFLLKASDEVAHLAAMRGRAGLPGEAQCRVNLIHPDQSEARCLLPQSHLREDSDHVDEHGHTAHVLVHQSTIDEVRRWQGETPNGLNDWDT